MNFSLCSYIRKELKKKENNTLILKIACALLVWFSLLKHLLENVNLSLSVSRYTIIYTHYIMQSLYRSQSRSHPPMSLTVHSYSRLEMLVISVVSVVLPIQSKYMDSFRTKWRQFWFRNRLCTSRGEILYIIMDVIDRFKIESFQNRLLINLMQKIPF